MSLINSLTSGQKNAVWSIQGYCGIFSIKQWLELRRLPPNSAPDSGVIFHAAAVGLDPHGLISGKVKKNCT